MNDACFLVTSQVKVHALAVRTPTWGGGCLVRMPTGCDQASIRSEYSKTPSEWFVDPYNQYWTKDEFRPAALTPTAHFE